MGYIKNRDGRLKNSESLEILKRRIINYIEYYNNERYQARYNFKTPNEVRNEAIRSKSKRESIKEYPIKENPKIIKFYKRLEEKNNQQQLQM